MHYISRAEYRSMQQPSSRLQIAKEFEPVYVIPEGGTNTLAINSCAAYIQQLPDDFDIISCACGTGGTLSGFIKGSNNVSRVLGFPVLKGGEFLYQDIQTLLQTAAPDQNFNNWELNTDYHFGGYGKSKPELEHFIQDFFRQYRIPLEPVYTGKMMFGLFDLIRKGHFSKGTRILAIHTGGLQGLDGFPELKSSMGL